VHFRFSRLYATSVPLHCKNTRIYTDISRRVFHILTQPVPYTFVSVNRRRNDEALIYGRFTDTSVYGTGSVKIRQARHRISADIRIFFTVCHPLASSTQSPIAIDCHFMMAYISAAGVDRTSEPIAACVRRRSTWSSLLISASELSQSTTLTIRQPELGAAGADGPARRSASFEN